MVISSRAWRLATVLALLCACRERTHAASMDEADAPARTATVELSSDARPAPLRGEWMEKVDLPDDGLAFVAPPVGATERRPIVVGVHGAVDDPGLMCSAWRLVTDVHPFVVCPAGSPIGPAHDRRYVWGSSDQIAKRVGEAIAAVEARYPDHVTKGAPVLYVAFSQGANMAGPVLARDAKRLPRAVLTEGGHRLFEDQALAKRYASAGGQRVLLTCSQPGCASLMQGSRAGLERAGIEARVLDCGPLGHSMPPPVREAIHASLPWIVDGMPGWEGYAAAPKLATH